MSSQLQAKMEMVKHILQYMPSVVLSKYWFRSSLKIGDSFKEIDLMSSDTVGLNEFLKENNIKMEKIKDTYIFSRC